MNSDDFLYIETILEEGSFSRAARRLDISQPALSARVSRLETRLQAQIFDRSCTPLHLTEAGEAYVQLMLRVREEERRLCAYLADLRGLRGGSLLLAGSSCFTTCYLPRLLTEFHHLYPQVHLQVRNGRIPELAQLTLAGRLDLFISPLPEAAEEDGLLYHPFLQERVFLCLPVEWPLNQQLAAYRVPAQDLLDGSSTQRDYTLLPAEAVAAVPRIVLQEDQHIRAVADRFFAATAAPPSPPLIADQMMSSFALTCAGAGLSLITDSVIRYGNYARLPAFYAFAPALSCRTLALASRRGGYLSHAAEEFLRLTRACYASPASSV